jgi:hypothetical protein
MTWIRRSAWLALFLIEDRCCSPQSDGSRVPGRGAASANIGAASDVLTQLTELSKQRYVSPYRIALIHAGLGNIDEAFLWLEKVYDERVEWMIYINVDPRLDSLRTDSRFSDLLGRLGFATGY